MPKPSGEWLDRTGVLIGLILFQCLCALVFVIDISVDLRASGGEALTLHLVPELAATAGLVVGIALQIKVLIRLLRRQARMAQGLDVARGALAELMEGYFRDWALTPSEQDVAAFAIKGFSIAEIAGLRGSAEATVKTHLNAIYRKAGVAGRSQLVSVLVEDLLRAPLVPGQGMTDRRGSADAPGGDG